MIVELPGNLVHQDPELYYGDITRFEWKMCL